MKQFFFITVFVITPFFVLTTEAQNVKKSGKEKKPKYEIVGKVVGYSNQAYAHFFSGTIIVQTTHGNDTVESCGDRDILILCRNSNGDITSYFTIGGPGKDTVCCMTSSHTDTLLIAGGYSDTAKIADSQCIARSGMDAFLVRVTKSGKVLWMQTWGASGDDCCTWVWRPGKDVETRVRYEAKENEDIHVVSSVFYTAPSDGVYIFTLRFNHVGRLISDTDRIFPTF
ncbi:MAG: hypothetical protein MUD00_01075 [Candidatus Pacebacteria bacterium]|jgi:hypothetical protein|nr:hypothetical protein [Candidatus Paceibacterota bacterium]